MELRRRLKTVIASPSCGSSSRMNDRMSSRCLADRSIEHSKCENIFACEKRKSEARYALLFAMVSQKRKCRADVWWSCEGDKYVQDVRTRWLTLLDLFPRAILGSATNMTGRATYAARALLALHT